LCFWKLTAFVVCVVLLRRAFFNALFGSDAPDVVSLGAFSNTPQLLWWPAVTSAATNDTTMSTGKAQADNSMGCDDGSSDNNIKSSSDNGRNNETGEVDDYERNQSFNTDAAGECRARSLRGPADAAVHAKNSPSVVGPKSEVVALLNLAPPMSPPSVSSTSSSNSAPLPSVAGCALAIVARSGRVRVLAPSLRVSAGPPASAAPMTTDAGSSASSSEVSTAAMAYPAALGFADFTLRGVGDVVCAVSVPGAIVHCDGRGTVYVTPLFDTDSSNVSGSSCGSSATFSRLVPTPGFASALPLPPGTNALTIVESIDSIDDNRSTKSSRESASRIGSNSSGSHRDDSGWLVMLRKCGAVCAVSIHQLAHAAAHAFEDGMDGDTGRSGALIESREILEIVGMNGIQLNAMENDQPSKVDEVNSGEEEEDVDSLDETCNQRVKANDSNGSSSGQLHWACEVGNESALQFKPTSLRESGHGTATIQLKKRLAGLRAATISASTARYHRLEATYALAQMATNEDFCSRCANGREVSNAGCASACFAASSNFSCLGFQHVVQLVTSTEPARGPNSNQASGRIMDYGSWVGECGDERSWNVCDAAVIKVELAADNTTAQLLSGGGWSYNLAVSLDDHNQGFSSAVEHHDHFGHHNSATDGEDATLKKETWARGGEESRRSLTLPLATMPWGCISPSSNSNDVSLCTSWTARFLVPHFPSGPSGAARPLRLRCALLYSPPSGDFGSSSSHGSVGGHNHGAAVDLGALRVSSLSQHPKPPPQSNVDPYPAGLRRATAALRARHYASFGVTAAAAAAAANNGASSSSGVGGGNNHGSGVGGLSSAGASSSFWVGPPPLPPSWGGPRCIAEGPSPHSIPVHTFSQRIHLHQLPDEDLWLPGRGGGAASVITQLSIDDVDEALRRVVAAVGTPSMTSARWGGSYGRGAQGNNNTHNRSRQPPAAAIRPGPRDLATLHTRQHGPQQSPPSTSLPVTNTAAFSVGGNEVVVQCTSRALLANLHANVLDTAAATAASARVENRHAPHGVHGISTGADASAAWEASGRAEMSAVVDGIRQQLQLAHFQAAQRAAQRQAAAAAALRDPNGLKGMDEGAGRDEALRRASLDLLDLYQSLRDATGKGAALL